ncbi:unnamed protein product [Victoria cruziana]
MQCSCSQVAETLLAGVTIEALCKERR